MTGRLQESEKGWVLVGEGAVTEARIEHGIVLLIGDDATEWEIRIGTSLHVRGPNVDVEIDPEHPPADIDRYLNQFVGPLDDLIAHRTGVLEIRTAHAVEITVSPNPTYEAWTLTSSEVAPLQQILVARPGGGLTTWT